MPDQHGRTLGKRTVAAVAIDAGPQGGAATEESVTIGNGLYLLGKIGGSGVSFLVDTGSGVSILAARKWKEWGRTEDELTRYWGRLCSVEGRALECLGKARLTVTLGTRVVEWGFIVAEIGDDEGILGNDFAMAHELTVRPCEGAVYLPDPAETRRGHLGERLPCTVRVVTEVRTITEETLAVRAVGPATLAPHAITQVRVIVPTPWACGTVMVDRGPGPLGLCPVRGIVEVEQASNIWLANPGSRPIQLDGDEVVALAECVLAGPGASAGSDRDIGDEVNGLVERASPHLTREECRQLQMAMAARKHLFAKGKGDLGRTDIVQHRIHTGDQPAIKQRVRRYPAARREEERQLVEDMLAIGIIQESNSAWSSPTVLVKKKDGTTRFCIDYRRLNQATKVDAYPLPHIEDSLNMLGGARFFCSLDLASGYWQVEMDAADREKTAFVTQGGLYEFRVMPFGLVNAPATFERLMERVLRGIAWSECLVYLDDILVFGPDFGTTLARLEKVLDRLGEAGLKLKAKKCQLFQEEIPFLGHIVSAAGIGADPTKCQQVRDWPVPRDLHEVRSFVGLCSYYRRHIQGFTELAAPLYELATKGTEFEWTDRRHEAFGQLKNALTSAPILGFPREDGLWYLDTDASDVGTGAVLSQVQDEEERVIAYVSKSLEGSEQRYCTARKELLAVVRALKHFKCYLYGQKITVRTDNSAVSWLHRSKDPVGQPARWIEVIDTYDITFQHRPGRKHGNADALSQYPCRQCGGDCEAPVKTVRAVTRSQECEPGWTHEEMAARQDADPDIGPIMRWKRVGNDRPRWEDISPESRETKVLWRQWERLYLVRGVLHRQFHELEGQGWRPQLVVPADRRGSLLQRFHGGMIGAHLGMTRTMALAEQGFYWPGMRADVSRICNECDCAMLKRRRGRREPLHQYIVGVPMERLAMDVAGPYPVTSAGNQYCLMVGCYFSKWLECFPIPDQKATTVARKLVFEIVARYGAFRELHSDQGTNFGSKVVLEVCRLFGIHKTRTTPYHPRSDGFIERSFRTLGRCLKAACRETKQEWDELVPLILMSYRATPQASTGVTPNMMMLGLQTRLPVQAMYGAPLGPEEEASTVSEYVAALQGGLRAAYRHARAGLQRAALHQKHDYDGKVQRREYQAGELVWIHDITLERTRGTKLQFPWFGPALITKVLDRGRVVVRRKRDKPLAVMHVDRLETYRGTAVPAWMTTEQRECVAV